ncbi:MAG: DUF3857 and transglutaminase domain-containing protein [candidate division Zixibacteria bacterium]|nr:DUF3857 and transglutaminase domain-containing protein [candidate division Zixibacteria bacterium]
MMVCKASHNFILVTFSIILITVFYSTGHTEPKWLKEVIESAVDVKVDKKAPAIVIFDEERVIVSKNGKSKNRGRFAIKICTSSGISKGISRINIHSARKVKNLKGWLIKPNGQKIDLKKKDIVTIDLQNAAGYYGDSKTVVAKFSDVEVGDIIGYEYNVIENEPWCSYNHAFIFQADLPTLQSHFIVELPEGWTLNESCQNIDSISRTVNDNIYEWKFGSLPYRKEEPYMVDWTYINRRIDVSFFDPEKDNLHLFDDWGSVADWAFIKFSESIDIDSTIIKSVETIKSSSHSPTELIQGIAVYVRDQIRYVAVEIGEGRYKPREATRTLSNRFGDCKDKTTLMISMLKAAGVVASPVLAVIGDEIDAEFPSPYQFNHAIVAIKLDSSISQPSYLSASVNNWLYFDPTNPASSLGELPVPLYNSKVLRVSENNYELITLPPLIPEQYLRKYFAEARLGSDNSLTAQVSIIDYNRKGSNTKYHLKTESIKDQIKIYQKRFSRAMQNPRLSNFISSSGDDSSQVSFLLKADNYASEAGNMLMMSLDFFHAGQELGKLEDIRLHPITFGDPGLYKTEILWALPEGWQFDSEDSIIADCKIAELKSVSKLKEKTLDFNSSYKYLGGSIPSTEYKAGYEFIKKRKSARDIIAIINKK